MEEKRKAEAIGGVYGSPYWVKQLYLGYHSLNLRLFVGEHPEEPHHVLRCLNIGIHAVFRDGQKAEIL